MKYLLLVFALVSAAVFAAEEPSQKTRGLSEREARSYSEQTPPFGGRNSPAGEIAESDNEKDPALRFPAFDDEFDAIINWKTRQNEERGMRFSVHYSTMYQNVSDELPGTDGDASGGVLRGTMQWALANRGQANEGSLNIMIDHRHAFGDTPPAGLAGSAGYIGVTSLFYSDTDWDVINLNWQQTMNEGRTGFIIGRYDPNDYMNVLGYVNPWTIFSNLESSLDTSIALPDSSWGVGAGHWITDSVYVLGGINDANGVGSDDLEWFDGGSEFFKYAHLGWSPSRNDRYFKNIHILVWDVDEREDAGVSDAHGVSIAMNWTFKDRFMPFLRIGHSSGDAPIYNDSVTLGFIWKYMYRSDLFGIAATWGDPPSDALPEQKSVEAFWRFQFSETLAITPSFQYLQDPALNPDEDSVWIFGLRTRLAL